MTKEDDSPDDESISLRDLDPIYALPPAILGRAMMCYRRYLQIDLEIPRDEVPDRYERWFHQPRLIEVTVEFLHRWDQLIDDDPSLAAFTPSWYVAREAPDAE